MNRKEPKAGQKPTEEDPRESERRYRNLADSLPQTVAEIDIEGNITFTNLMSFTMFGYTKEDFDKGLNIFQMIAPEERERARENIQKFMKGQKHDGEQYAGVRKDGSRFPFTVYMTPVFRENKTVGFRIILIDVTERKRSEEALRSTQMQLSQAMDLAHIVYWEADPIDNVFLFNDAFYALYGTTAEQEGGYKMTREEFAKRFVHPDDLLLVSRFVEQNTLKPDTELIADIEHRIIRRDGEVRHVLIRASVVKDDSGHIIKRYGANQDITERKQAEQAKKTYHAMSERTRDILLFISMDGHILEANKAAEIAYEYTKEELLKLNIRDLRASETLHTVNEQMGRAGSEGILFETIHRRKDGTLFPVEVSSQSATFGEDQVLLSVVRDITERKRTEDDLRASQQIIKAILNAIPVRVFWKDENLVYLGCNTIFARDAGFDDPKDIIGKDDYQMVWRDQAESYRNDDLQVIESGCAKLSIEEPQTTPDGNTITLLTSKIPLHNSNGETIGVLGTYMDITDRKKIEKTLQESEEQFRKMFEGNPLGMVMVGSDFRFIRANAAFCRMIGYTNEELTSLTFKDITHADHIAEDVRHVTDLIDGNIPFYQTEKRYVPKDKEVIWGSIIVNVMRDREDRFLYFFTTVEDITQRKNSEEEKVHLESQLFQSQKMEAVGTLAGGIAHDFNNILTVISGFGSLLKMDMKKGDPKEAYIDQILTSSEKAAQLTQGLLAFSRKQQIIPKRLDLNNSIRATSKLLKRLLTDDIELKIRLSKKDVTIMADATQIDQILFNLATNARDAMPHGGTLIIETNAVELSDEFVNAHGRGTRGECARLSVSDTGSGMDEATQGKVFEPFFTTKEVGKGTGLGLSTVYGIVKQHNGYINVYSEPNIGTTFHIYFPVVKEVSREDEDIQSSVQGGDETILVAEDNTGVRGFISRILKEHGYTVIEAIDGADAIEQFKKTDKIDLLVFDSVMPKKNGREAYDEIHKINPHIRVIFTSGYTKDVFLDKGIEDEEFNFLQKPISGGMLLQKVREVLDFGRSLP